MDAAILVLTSQKAQQLSCVSQKQSLFHTAGRPQHSCFTGTQEKSVVALQNDLGALHFLGCCSKAPKIKYLSILLALRA